jgi:hypothetical protein
MTGLISVDLRRLAEYRKLLSDLAEEATTA